MPDITTLQPGSKATLQQFIEQYRLQRATLGGVTFWMNPDIQQTRQWLTNLQPTGAGYVRWVFCAQPYTIRLDGTTGMMGLDSGNDTIGGAQQLISKFAPGWDTTGYQNMHKTWDFSYPSLGMNVKNGAYVDAFTISQTSQRSLYIFFSIQLTILPPKLARDYQAAPLPSTASTGTAAATTNNPNLFTRHWSGS